LSSDFLIAETESFQKLLAEPRYKGLYSKIRDFVYPQLKKNPFWGANIKKLKGDLSDYYRYRLGDYRLFYRIDSDKVIVFIVTISHRKDAY
jgi:mRNA interferase RelE/StbE